MLNDTVRDLVRATAPILQAHGEALTRHFYARLFQHNPEFKAIFNQGHQREGSQQQALAAAAAAYALHIDHPEVLMPVLERVAHKHASLGIRAEHYDIVGHHLLASIGEVLGEAATPALIDAWAAAYGQLAGLLIGLESALYQRSAKQPGGWTGWRTFVVQRKHMESEEICSLYLAPADGGKVPSYLPGQYVSVKVFVPELGFSQPRQYSLSSSPDPEGAALRISVKRERRDDQPQGMVSNALHDRLQPGDVLEVAPPQGDFVLHVERDTPVVLISAGVGLTPMVAMLEHLVAHAPRRAVTFLYACRHGGVHAFREHVQALASRHPQVTVTNFYETPTPQDAAHPHRRGRMDLQAWQSVLPAQDSDIYLCGPRPFMAEQVARLQQMGVAPARIHTEVFGTGGL